MARDLLADTVRDDHTTPQRHTARTGHRTPLNGSHPKGKPTATALWQVNDENGK